MTLLIAVTAMSAKLAIEAFTSGALLGAILYAASRTNKVVKHRRKTKQ